jgi:cysteinyl-tRNA synthetase
MATEHPEWFPPTPPAGYDLDSAPTMLNSLTGLKQKFIPIQSNQVSWYICGPTVYDSAHMGHARAYVTFDIIRRILQDFFGFDVTYVMNITDIDDKIILRARRNFLFDEFLKEIDGSVEKLVAAASDAFPKAQLGIQTKILDLATKLDDTEQRRHIKELNEKIEEEKLKFKNLTNEYNSFMELSSSANIEEPLLFEKIALVCKDVISQSLDKLKGAGISDHSIFQNHASKFESEFLKDMKSLGVRDADVLTRVSEYVPQIIKYVEKIIEHGYAYESNGSVYFDVVKFASSNHAYAKLKPQSAGNLDLLVEGEGVLQTGAVDKEKKYAGDFALWKNSKPGEPFWQSPWGNGRPGWHIECSAMASDILGMNFDVHSGGEDLMFPHHDNEIAQAEAFYDSKQWVNYFLHAGHLSIEGLKMSKSLKNFITIRQALEIHTPRQIRIAFILQNWESTMNYSDDALKEAVTKEKKLKEFFLQIQTFSRKGFTGVQGWNDVDKELHSELLKTQVEIRNKLADNFNYPGAFETLLSLISKTNFYMNNASDVKNPLLAKVSRYVSRILGVFGVLDFDGVDIVSQASGSGSADRVEILTPYLDSLCEFRDSVRGIAREKKHPEYLELCDNLRDDILPNLGLRLEDKSEKSIWKLVDPNELKEEILKKKQEQAQKKREKVCVLK